MTSVRAPRRVRPFVACLALSAVAAACASAQDAPDHRYSDGIVAIVEGEPITMHELELACRLHPDFHSLPQGDSRGESRERIEFKKQVLKEGAGGGELSLILQKVLLQRAKEAKVELTAADEERLNQELARVAERTRGGMEGLRAALAEIKVPFDYFVARKRTNLLITKLLLSNVSHAIFPTPAEVRHRYEEQKSRYERPGELRLRLLTLFPDPDDSVRSMRELDPLVQERVKARTWDARAFAAELRQRIARGELAFEDAQRRFSMGPYYDAEQVFRADERLDLKLRAPLPERIARLAAGELSEVIDSPHGLHLLHLVDRQERGVVPLEEVQQEIEVQLKEEVWLRRRDAWIADAKAKAHIEVFFPPPGN